MLKNIFLTSLLVTAALVAEVKVVAIAGSTRVGSLNKKLLNEAIAIAKQSGASVTEIDLKNGEIPFYDGDLEAKGMPEKVKEFRKQLIESQVIFIASPEYNGSPSAVLKNALDWFSRDEKGGPSRDAFKGKKVLLMSASPSPMGGAANLSHLKTIIENIGGTVVPEQITLANAPSAFDDEGHLKDEKIKKELQAAVQNALKN